MSTEIALVLLIIAVAVVLFVSEKLRVDLVALLVLGSLVITGLISPTEALAGFSNPAVITVWAVFILSGALARTGVANLIGNQVMRVAGDGQLRLLFIIMLTAAVLSAFMNNVGVAALLLPVVIEIAHKTRTPPSRLLMPLAFGALLGGLTTLIGTPSNILASDAMRDAGFDPFSLFDFAPVGVVIMLSGIIFIVFLGRRLLPDRDTALEGRPNGLVDLDQLYQLQEQTVVLRVPADSILNGATLAESQIGSMLGLNVLAIIRNGHTTLSPPPSEVLGADDRLLVIGEASQLVDLKQRQISAANRTPLTLEGIQEAGLSSAEIELGPEAPILGHSLAQVNFRKNSGLNVLAIQREGAVIRSGLPSILLKTGDILLVQGPSSRITSLESDGKYKVSQIEVDEINSLEERLLLVSVPQSSALVGKTLKESRLGEDFGLTILRLVRQDSTLLLPEPDEQISAGDMLLIQGTSENIRAVRGLESLVIDDSPINLEELETNQIGLVEAVLSPHTTLTGRTLKELGFREKYGLNVIALWRAGTAYRHDLGDMPLRFGDALLIHGPREKFKLLGADPDFIVLTEEAQEPARLKKAPIAIIIMLAVLLSVLVGWLPIAIAAIIGGTLMVLSGSLTMDEAYRYIEWPAVFLIAAMLPLGAAMENSGTTQFLADGLLQLVGDAGPRFVMAGLFILSVLASQVMPNPAVLVLMAPIAITAAADLNLAPQAFMMAIAIAASASFLSPVSHPANVLVMGPGGYRFSDYIKVGLPLTFLVFIIVLFIVPLVWKF